MKVISNQNPIGSTRAKNKYSKCVILLLSLFLCTSLIIGLLGCTTSNTRFNFREIDCEGTTYYSVEKCTPGKYIYDVTIPDTWQGLPVLSIESNAFVSGIIKCIDVGRVETIDPFAFAYCSELKTVDLQEVISIGNDAFSGCICLESVTIPTTVLEIGDAAFLNCENLRTVYFEGNPTHLGAELFLKQVHIFGYPGGTVEKYANENGLLFTPIDTAGD